MKVADHSDLIEKAKLLRDGLNNNLNQYISFSGMSDEIIKMELLGLDNALSLLDNYSKEIKNTENDPQINKTKYNEAIDDLQRVVKTFTRDLKHHIPKEEWLTYGIK